MRPVLQSDLLRAARALLGVAPSARARAADLLLARADAADRYRRRFGRAHPDWGNGTVLALASKTTASPQPSLDDPDFSDCLCVLLMALGRAGARPQARRD